jgi:hypothetical protein
VIADSWVVLQKLVVGHIQPGRAPSPTWPTSTEALPGVRHRWLLEDAACAVSAGLIALHNLAHALADNPSLTCKGTLQQR